MERGAASAPRFFIFGCGVDSARRTIQIPGPPSSEEDKVPGPYFEELFAAAPEAGVVSIGRPMIGRPQPVMAQRRLARAGES